jgi:hypothetical protein
VSEWVVSKCVDATVRYRCCCSTNTGGQRFDTQKLALVDLYWSTDGPFWDPGAAFGWVVYEEPSPSPACDGTYASILCDVSTSTDVV